MNSLRWSSGTAPRVLIPVLFLTLTGCEARDKAVPIDTIEVRTTGMFAERITIHANGRGELEQFLPNRKREFALKPGEFQDISARLRPYMRRASPFKDKSIFEPRCNAQAVDAGGYHIRWQGPGTNVHNWLGYDCPRWWWRWLPPYREVRSAVAELEAESQH